MQINKFMQEHSEDQMQNKQKEAKEPQGKPNESGTFHIDGFVKIFDPNTKEVYLETRT